MDCECDSTVPPSGCFTELHDGGRSFINRFDRMKHKERNLRQIRMTVGVVCVTATQSEMYLQRSLSTIFPPHIVDSMAFTEKTVSFP